MAHQTREALRGSNMPYRVPALMIALALAFGSAGCAALPPAKAVSDVAVLAGKWTGTCGSDRVGYNIPCEFTVRQDGSFEIFVPSGQLKIPGRFRVGASAIVYETETRIGSVTYHEDVTKMVIVGTTRSKDGGDPGGFQLSQPK